MEKPLGPLHEGVKVKQILIPPASSIIQSIYIRFGTYCRKNKSHLSVSLNENGKCIASWRINCLDIIDNAYQEFTLPKPIEISLYPPIWEIEFVCTSKNTSNGVAVFFDSENSKSTFWVGHRELEGSITYDFKFTKKIDESIERKSIGHIGLISVIVPTYNCSSYIENSIKSVLNQSYNFTEIIVVDDGSTVDDLKNTRDAIHNLEQEYKTKISLIEHEENKGASSARNTGALKARGEFLFFLDADTVLRRDAFSWMLGTLHIHPECSYAYCQFKWGDKTILSSPFKPDKLKRNNFASMMSLLRRIDFPESGLDESLLRYQDWELWIRLLHAGKIGIWIEEILFESFERKNSISNGGSISDREARKIISGKHPWAKIPIL